MTNNHDGFRNDWKEPGGSDRPHPDDVASPASKILNWKKPGGSDRLHGDDAAGPTSKILNWS